MTNRKSQLISRRKFIGTSSAAMAAFTIIPANTVAGLGHKAPSDTLNVAAVGIGGMGRNNITNVAKTENIIALCDVDWGEASTKVFDLYPKAQRFKDFRIMLDSLKEIDAVIIATSDHTHAVITMEAMKRGKHVFTQKPLTQTVYESRVLAKAAKEYKVASQMGNQGQAGDAPRRLREMIWDGVIGPVTDVHVWTDRPNNGLFRTYWPQGVNRPEDTPPTPQTLDWDLFIGPAPMRPYHPAYHPFKWRGWWDFGVGALGDIGCHSFDPVFRALKLKYPLSVEAVSTIVNDETYPLSSMIRYQFPARENMPPVTLTWYDGGMRPFNLKELTGDAKMGTGGTLFIGSKGKILDGRILPETLRASYTPPAPSIPSSPGHEEEWIRACKGGEAAGSDFEWAGPLTETVLLGNIALRKSLKEKLSGQILQFDPVAFRFPNAPEADQFLHHEYRAGWSLK